MRPVAEIDGARGEIEKVEIAVREHRKDHACGLDVGVQPGRPAVERAVKKDHVAVRPFNIDLPLRADQRNRPGPGAGGAPDRHRLGERRPRIHALGEHDRERCEVLDKIRPDRIDGIAPRIDGDERLVPADRDRSRVGERRPMVGRFEDDDSLGPIRARERPDQPQVEISVTVDRHGRIAADVRLPPPDPAALPGDAAVARPAISDIARERKLRHDVDPGAHYIQGIDGAGDGAGLDLVLGGGVLVHADIAGRQAGQGERGRQGRETSGLHEPAEAESRHDGPPSVAASHPATGGTAGAGPFAFR